MKAWVSRQIWQTGFKKRKRLFAMLLAAPTDYSSAVSLGPSLHAHFLPGEPASPLCGRTGSHSAQGFCRGSNEIMCVSPIPGPEKLAPLPICLSSSLRQTKLKRKKRKGKASASASPHSRTRPPSVTPTGAPSVLGHKGQQERRGADSSLHLPQ